MADDARRGTSIHGQEAQLCLSRMYSFRQGWGGGTLHAWQGLAEDRGAVAVAPPPCRGGRRRRRATARGRSPPPPGGQSGALRCGAGVLPGAGGGARLSCGSPAHMPCRRSREAPCAACCAFRSQAGSRNRLSECDAFSSTRRDNDSVHNKIIITTRQASAGLRCAQIST
jgi:hypothetical protein